MKVVSSKYVKKAIVIVFSLFLLNSLLYSTYLFYILRPFGEQTCSLFENSKNQEVNQTLNTLVGCMDVALLQPILDITDEYGIKLSDL